MSDMMPVLATLERLAEESYQVRRSITQNVWLARVQGASWAQIADVLGMTRQAAWEKWRGGPPSASAVTWPQGELDF